MPFFHYDGIRIAGIAAAVPKQCVSVSDFEPQFGRETVERFIQKAGIRAYRKTPKYQTASDLGYIPAERLLEEKAIDRSAVGALLFVTQSADYRRPATACVLHKRLRLSKECAAYDITLGCSATPYGLQAACSMLANSDMEYALLILSETVTKLVNPKDPSLAMLFGDAGAAILLEKRRASAPINILLRTDGEGYRHIIAPAGGFRNPDAPHDEFVWPDGIVRSLYNTYMSGTDVFSFGISDVPDAICDFFAKTGETVRSYDCFAMHQANASILHQIAKKLKIPAEKMPLSLERYGNTSAASPELTLCEAYGIYPSQTLRALFCCFGVGLSWGVASAELSTDDIYPVTETDDHYEEGFINKPF